MSDKASMPKGIRISGDSKLTMFNPVTELDKAFFKYSAAGPMGHVAEGHFSCYAKNHQDWLDEIQEQVEKERA